MLRKIQYPLILFGVLILVFYPLWVGTGLLQWDALTLHLPWRYHVTESFRNGYLPLWNPFMNGGFAQMADPATWYPIGWLFGLFTRYTAFSLNYEYLFHLFIAGWGFFKVTQQFNFKKNTSLILSISLMLSGFFISNAQHLGWLIGFSWFIWSYYSLDKWIKTYRIEDLLLLVLFFFFMLTGGYPGITITAAYVLLVRLVVEGFKLRKSFSFSTKIALQFSITLFIGLALSALILLPAFELSSVFRTEGLEPNDGKWGLLSGSLTIPSLLTFFTSIGASINDYDFWKTDFALVNSYFGLLSLVGMVVGIGQWKVTKKPFVFFLIGLFFVVLSLANILPLRLWLSHLPFGDVFRFATLFRAFAIFFFLLAAGYGMDAITNENQNLNSKKYILGALAFFFLLFLGYLKLVNFSEPLNWNSIPIQMAFHALVQIVLLAIFWSVLNWKVKWVPTVLLILVVIDFGVATYWNARTTVFENKSAWEVSEKILKLPKAYPTPNTKLPIGKIDEGWLYEPEMHIWANLGIMHKQPTLAGASPYFFNDQKEAQQKGWVDEVKKFPVVFYQKGSLLNDDLIDSLNVLSAEKSNLRVLDFQPNEWTIQINPDQSGFLVLLQNNYFHWKAELDGNPTVIRPVNGTFLGIQIPKGEHEVTFRFEPPYALPLFILCLLTLVSIVVFLVYSFLSPHYRD